jgi:N-formylglutamate amidohydrolase
MSPRIECGEAQGPFDVRRPERQSLPIVLASPHSGRDYPEDFVASSRLDPLTLRRSEDSFVDEIFGSAPALGVPLISARFPRAYVDPNREPFELDPAMFADVLPDYANVRSPRVAAGLGTIARVVANGADIYRDKLTFAEALKRIRGFYWPYHRALKDLIEQTRDRFGYCVLIDCHSMPSIGGPADYDSAGGRQRVNRVDVVLGDCHGTACATELIDTASATLARQGYRVTRNSPYSGGFVTRHYGRPSEGLHALQIELNRMLYMDEKRITRKPEIEALCDRMSELVATIGGLAPRHLLP